MSAAAERVRAFARREPLVHFLILAGLLFTASALWSDDGREVIVLDRATQEFLIRQQSDLALRPLSPAEEKAVIANAVEEEILWREAYRQGHDKNPRIRRQLVTNMRFLLSGEAREPTEAELRDFYEASKHQFEAPPMVALQLVYFRDPDQTPAGTLAALRSGGNPATLGDSHPTLGRSIPPVPQRQLVLMFGPDAAREIVAIEDDDWYGPLQSPRGAHFIRIAERLPARPPSFEETESYLAGAWQVEQQRKRLEAEVQLLSQTYEIVVEPRETDSDGP